jgi:hypothetical protein
MSQGRWSRLILSRRRVVTYVVVILVLLLLRVVADLWAGSHLASVKARLAPIYNGLDVASLAPPAIRPAENRARVLAAAAALVVGDSSALGGALSTFSVSPKDPVKRDAVLRKAVADNRAALQVLDEAESRPKSNWDITYRDGPRLRVPSLMEIRNLENVNTAAGLVDLADGRPDEAVRRVRLGVVLGASMAQESVLIVQLIRFAVTRTAYQLLQNVLSTGEPSAVALRTLQVPLDDEANRASIVTGLIGELKLQSSLLDGVESGRQSVGDTGVVDHPLDRVRFARTAEACLAWCLRPGVRVVHAHLLEQLHQFVEYARLQPFERQARSLRRPSEEPQPWWWRLAPGSFTAAWDGLGRANESGDEQRALATLAATSVALRRCRLDRGSYPASLDELVPAFLPRVLADPYTGRPPEYKRDGSGFELRVIPEQNADGTRGLLDWRMAR